MALPPLNVVRSNVRSIEPVAGRPSPVYRGFVLLAYSAAQKGWVVNGGVQPCSGRSIAIPTSPASASESPSKIRLVRSAVRPCSKSAMGQPDAGFAIPEAALGTVISTGTCNAFTVATGSGLKRVVSVLVLSGAVAAAACQYSVSGAVGLTSGVAR